MEHSQFQKIQGWFEILGQKFDGLEQKVDGLDQKVDGLDLKVNRIENTMATKKQLENRTQMLFVAIQNLQMRLDNYKDQSNSEIMLIKRAIHDMEQEIKQLQSR